MTYEQFVFWLRGYLKGESPNIEEIKNNLNGVGHTISIPWIQQKEQNIYKNDFYENCSCNPKNGGSGICGCVLSQPTITYKK